MKHLFIAGNWKSNKTSGDASAWLEKFSATWENATVVLCASFTILGPLQWQMKQKGLSIELAAQDVSPFGEGAYTGEVSGRQVKEYANWVLIGHSERRKHFGETDEVLAKKVEQAKLTGLKIIYCVQDANIAVPAGVDVVAYEPYFAIGTGQSDTPENANAVIAGIKAKTQVSTVIYGGSVTHENVASFISQESIDGVLPGGASLDPEKFAKLIEAASA